MADWHEIRRALATKCLGVTGINAASADEITGAPDTPAVFIENIASLDMVERGTGYEKREADINASLLISRSAGTGPAAETADDLLEAIDVAFRSGIQLGFTGVVQDAWRDTAEEDFIRIGKIEYVGYRITFHVVVRENVTRSAT